MAGDTSITFNQDVQIAVKKLDRAIDEMGKSASARDTDFLGADLDRLNRYLAGFQSFVNYIAAQPDVDYAETHALTFPLPPIPVHPDAENELVQLAMNQLLRMRQELATGQSSRRASGLHEDDKRRVDTYLDRARALVSDYIASVNPQDYPGSSPSRAVGKEPRSGV